MSAPVVYGPPTAVTFNGITYTVRARQMESALLRQMVVPALREVLLAARAMDDHQDAGSYNEDEWRALGRRCSSAIFEAADAVASLVRVEGPNGDVSCSRVFRSCGRDPITVIDAIVSVFGILEVNAKHSGSVM